MAIEITRVQVEAKKNTLNIKYCSLPIFFLLLNYNWGYNIRPLIDLYIKKTFLFAFNSIADVGSKLF